MNNKNVLWIILTATPKPMLGTVFAFLSSYVSQGQAWWLRLQHGWREGNWNRGMWKERRACTGHRLAKLKRTDPGNHCCIGKECSSHANSTCIGTKSQQFISSRWYSKNTMKKLPLLVSAIIGLDLHKPPITPLWPNECHRWFGVIVKWSQTAWLQIHFSTN